MWPENTLKEENFGKVKEFAVKYKKECSFRNLNIIRTVHSKAQIFVSIF